MKCEIRRWRPEDAGDLSAALNNSSIQRNLRDGLPLPYTRSDAEAYISSMLAADPDSCFAFAITAGDRVIGSIGAFRKDNVHRLTAELGYYIAEEFWGKGLGTEAVRLAVTYVFTHSDILRIFAEPFARNAASCRILEKNGFSFEGVLRSNAVKDSQVLDMRMYSLLREEFFSGNDSKPAGGVSAS